MQMRSRSPAGQSQLIMHLMMIQAVETQAGELSSLVALLSKISVSQSETPRNLGSSHSVVQYMLSVNAVPRRPDRKVIPLMNLSD